jgi:hypothetical protein
MTANFPAAARTVGIIAVLFGVWAAAQAAPQRPASDAIDLSNGVIVLANAGDRHLKFAELLRDEIAHRTGIALERVPALQHTHRPAIVLGTINAIEPTPALPAGLAVPATAEGYALWVDREARPAPTVYLMGRDDRGALFAAGALLRTLRMKPNELVLDPHVRIATAPQYPVRGHELGYRNKSNTYDAWSIEQYEQYIRDLAVFGSNAVQLLFDSDMSPKEGAHMTESAWDRLPKLSALVGSYGLDVWLWLPVSDGPLGPAEMDRALEVRRALFERCPRIDVVFVPGGDPGGTHPEILLPWMAKLAAVLAESHPNAQLWLSNEDMEHAWNDYLFEYLQTHEPPWLDGIVFGTWVKLSLADQRARTPKRYPIVRYADITHSIQCQYPVPSWDLAYACTLGREGINPRPMGMAHIHNALAPLADGFITYSDGVNDDVNKFVWAAMGWEPQTDVRSVLTEYGRFFVGEDVGEAVAEGLLALERNWEGPLRENVAVEDTLAQWQAIEKAGDLGRWRLQSALFRAYYDAYIRQRLLADTQREAGAREALARASTAGVAAAIQDARRILEGADDAPVAPELRRRIEELGDALFTSIGMQLSVERYGANHWERGAVLDALDRPLNDRGWLEAQFAAILAQPDDQARLELLHQALTWEDPGPGGFYDDLGNAAKQPHLVHQKRWVDDPGFVNSPQDECIEVPGRDAWRLSWLNQAQTLFGTPLKMRYEGLDPTRPYRLQVVYTGRFRPAMRVTANGRFTIHESLPQPPQPERQAFDIPREATANGVLELEWHNTAGRGCQVAEVWLTQGS